MVAATAPAAPLRTSATARGFFIGAAISMTPFRGETAYVQTVQREFNMIVAENAMKMDALRPSASQFNFADADALMDFATANNMAVRGHVLVWHNQIPNWLRNGNFTREQVIDIMRDHIMNVVGRYRGRIVAWDVVNEAISDNNGQMRTDSFWFQRLGADYIPLAFQFAHEADPAAKLYYNDYEAEGSGAKSDAVFNLVSGLVAQGVPINGVGWQMHKINPFRISSANTSNAQRIANLGLEISITEMDIRIATPSDATELQQQALGYGDATRFCLATPACKALVTWGVTDRISWVPGTFPGFGDPLLFDGSFQIKPAYTAVQTELEAGMQQAPATPTGLTATPGNAQVALSWSPAARATSYNVKRATVSGGPYTTVGTPTTTSFTNTGLTNGTTYFFVVSAVNAVGQSPNSGQVSATPQATQTPNFTLSANPASVSVARGASATSTITVTRTAFTAAVGLAASGLPSGVTATFNPVSVTGTSSLLTFAASATATTGTSTVTVTGTGGGLTRTTTIALTVSGGGTGDGGVSVTAFVQANSPWFNEEQVRITSTAPLTALSITVVVQRTGGISHSGQYNTVGGQITQSNSSTATAITYTFGLAPGQTLGTGNGRIFAAQTSGTGTIHSTTADTFTVTYTTGGQTFTQSGHF